MSSLVCTGAVVTGILQTNGRKVIVGLVAAALLASLTGVTVTPTVGAAGPVTFGAAQSLPAGASVSFASQPGVTYTLLNAVTGGTIATLTTNYTGPAGATTMNGMADATWTATGPTTTLTFGAAQTLPVGFQFQVNGAGTVYTLTTALSAATALPQADFSPAWVGPTGAVTVTAANPVSTPVLTIPAVGATDSSPTATARVVQSNGEATSIVAMPWATFLATLSTASPVVTPAGTPTVPSTAITFGAAQTLPAGFPLVFASQPGVTYYLAAPIAAGTAGVLTEPYNGPSGATTASSTGFKALTSSSLGVFDCVGADRQPVQFVAVAAASLVP